MSTAPKIFMGAGASALPIQAAAPDLSSLKPRPAPGGLTQRATDPSQEGGRQFGAPVQNQLGSMKFKNLQPQQGGLAQRATGTPSAVPGTGSGNPPADPQSTNGFQAYLSKSIGAAGFQKSGSDRKAGWVAQSGEYKGQTREEAEGALREKYAAMPPEERSAYEAMGQNADVGDQVSSNGPGFGQAAPAAAPAATTPEQSGGLAMRALKGVDGVSPARQRRNPLQEGTQNA